MTTTTAKTATKTIAGHEFALTVGRRYLASRPMAAAPRVGVDRETTFPVSITDVTDGINGPVAARVSLSYGKANDLLRRFNNGATSFEGRVW